MSEKEKEEEKKKGLFKRIRSRITGCVIASIFVAILILLA